MNTTHGPFPMELVNPKRIRELHPFYNLDRVLAALHVPGDGHVDRLVSGYVRMEQKSGLIGIYEKANPNAVWLDGCPWEAENEFFEPDYDRITLWLENAMERNERPRG